MIAPLSAQAPILHGSYRFTFCPKGRLVIPAPFRAVLGPALLVTLAPRQSLLIGPGSTASALLPKWMSGTTTLPLASGAHLVSPSSIGRIVVPIHLRTWANLFAGCEVAVTGIGGACLVQRAEAFDARLCVVMERMYRGWCG